MASEGGRAMGGRAMIVDQALTPFLRLPHFKGKTRIETFLRRLLWKPHGTQVFGGVSMELDLAEWTQMQLLKRNWLEPRTLELYGQLLRPGDVFVDVGAHVGFHSLVARKIVGPEGIVVCVEPQPYNAHKILSNWRANGFANLKLVVAAAGAKNGAVELSDQVLTDRSVLTLLERGGKNEAQKFEVPLVRLDSLLQRHELKTVKLLKLDVEGYELQVLHGAGARLGDIQNVVFEVLDAGNYESTKPVVDLLEHAGFELLTIEGAPWNYGTEIMERNLWARRVSA
ncbi:MAG: FkbM family methyltransferase [Chthoniobacterales bacterium]